jgi:2-amino-4-hydroxy-6-hydroxymethyldihydropteridine diphosphokinase
MATCLIGLGANLGDAEQTLREVIAQLQRHARISKLVVSSFHGYAAIGGPRDQPPFLNAAARFETSLSPQDVLAELHRLEAHFGRERAEVWGPRTLDLDLLLYDGLALTTPALTVPHPRMTFRRFVLEPAAEIAGDLLHPATGLTLSQLLMHVNSAPRYVALASTCWFAKQYVARTVVARLRETGVLAQAATLRGVSHFGGPLVTDPEHSLVEHYEDLLPRLASELSQSLAQAANTWLVSSYWLGELELAARGWFSGDARAAAERSYRDACASFPRPKLVVYLTTPNDLLLFDPAQPGRTAPWYEQAQRLVAERDRLEAHVGALQGVPLLRLSAEHPELAIREVQAAVQAMQ